MVTVFQNKRHFIYKKIYSSKVAQLTYSEINLPLYRSIVQ